MELFFRENEIDQLLFPVTNATIEEEDQELIDRNFNITWIDKLPEQNEISAGAWFSDGAINGLSISESIAERYDLKIETKYILRLMKKLLRLYSKR